MTRRSGPAAVLLLAVAGTAHALLQVLGNLDHRMLFSVYLFGDSELYLAYAGSYLTGRAFDLGLPFHPPLAAWMLVPVLAGLGDSASRLLFKAVLSLQAGGLTAATTILATRLGGRLAGVAAGALTALSFGMAVLATVPGGEAPYLLITLPTWLLLVSGTPGKPRVGLAVGLLTGLACLARAEHLLLVPVVLLFTGWSAPRLRPAASRAVLLCLVGILVVLAPWTIRNHARLRRYNRQTAGTPDRLEPLPTLVPVSIYGPLNFALANLPPSEGEFTRAALPPGGTGAGLDPGEPRHRELLIHGYRIGFQALRADPGRALRLGGRKLAIASEAMALGWTASSVPTGLGGVRRPIDLFAPDRTWLRWPVLLLAGVGWCILLRRRPRAAWLLLLVILHRLLIILGFFGYVRQGILLWPLAMILGVLPLSSLGDRSRLHRWLSIPLAALVVAGLIHDGWTARTPRSFQVRYGTLPGSDRIDQHLRLELEPTDPD